jgi:cytochrome c-type biogenesis protein CcmH
MAAAQDMTPEERMGFIRQMVEGLAQRLEEKPDDLEGWLRLIRAYQVLGEPEKAAEALKKAEPLAAGLPEEAPQRQALEAAKQALAAGR